MQNLRRVSQALLLLIFLFLFLQTESVGKDELGYPVRLFLDFNPLILLTTLISTHTVTRAFFWSLLTIALTILLGRFFCGWVCPLGTLNNMVGTVGKKNRYVKHADWHRFKYFILIFILFASLFGVQLVGVLDPVSLIIRSFSLSVFPLFNHSVRAFFDTVYELDPPGVVHLSEGIYSVLKKTVLSFQQPYFLQGIFIGSLFFLVLGLNLIERRFWCRYLCPLGALLGLLSRFSLLKRSVSENCTECGACAGVCQGNASPDVRGRWQASECYYCWNCDDVCPQNAVSFGFLKGRRATTMNLGRRQVVFSAVAGVISVPLLRSVPSAKALPLYPTLIRPPGSLPERQFLARCVKCGECMKVCITNGLQPTLLEAGLEGIWSPMLVPRLGYCEYRCTLCGQVCPTGAIRQLNLDEKKQTKIGLATVDKNRCLPWSHATSCIVCEEVCPTPQKAIWFEKATVVDREGNTKDIKRPRVDIKLCIGCGICEAKCPVQDKPAIYVTNIGESRSDENQLLLF